MENDFGDFIASGCIAKCGDGKRNDAEECDDGNNDSGDGCDADCYVEDGYFRSGSSNFKPSTCKLYPEGRTLIILRQSTFDSSGGSVIQSVKLTYLPDYFRKTQCRECSQLLDVKVPQTIGVGVAVQVQYIPNT